MPYGVLISPSWHALYHRQSPSNVTWITRWRPASHPEVNDRSSSRRCLCFFFCIELVHRIPLVLPRLQSSGERPHARNSDLLEFHGDLRARGFTGTRAVQNDLAVQWNLSAPQRQLVRRDSDRRRTRTRIYQKFQLVPQVHHKGPLAAIERRLEFLHSHARHAQRLDELLPLYIFPDDVRDQHDDQQS